MEPKKIETRSNRHVTTPASKGQIYAQDFRLRGHRIDIIYKTRPSFKFEKRKNK